MKQKELQSDDLRNMTYAMNILFDLIEMDKDYSLSETTMQAIKKIFDDLKEKYEDTTYKQLKQDFANEFFINLDTWIFGRKKHHEDIDLMFSRGNKDIIKKIQCLENDILFKDFVSDLYHDLKNFKHVTDLCFAAPDVFFDLILKNPLLLNKKTSSREYISDKSAMFDYLPLDRSLYNDFKGQCAYIKNHYKRPPAHLKAQVIEKRLDDYLEKLYNEDKDQFYHLVINHFDIKKMFEKLSLESADYILKVHDIFKELENGEYNQETHSLKYDNIKKEIMVYHNYKSSEPVSFYKKIFDDNAASECVLGAKLFRKECNEIKKEIIQWLQERPEPKAALVKYISKELIQEYNESQKEEITIWNKN